jgi:phosphohistidine swiveling domain-containing protein
MDVKDKIKSLTWEKWLQRRFKPLVTSLFKDGIRKEYFEKIGVPNVECKAQLLQHGFWYKSKEVHEEMAQLLEVYLKDHSIFDITKSLEEFHKQKKERVKALAQEEGDPIKQLKEVYEILTTCTTFIWLAHGLEEVYKKRLQENVPKYIHKDVDKFIGDASFPKKKNTHALMEEAMRKGEDPQIIAEKFGWLRARDGFTKPFSVEDIKEMMNELKPLQPHPKVKIPPELQPLFKEMQELVFFRTSRTDIFYELLFLSRPILRRVGELYNIPFSELQYYTIQSLIEGNPKRYSENHTLACYKEEAFFGEEPLIEEEEVKEADHVKGNIACKGLVRGVVKIVRIVSDLSKVKEGDILVTQMTFPAFITAMKRAAAFVTDEGGLTCHAAIVAREMKKPCIIGTKVATRIFKDGDLVEVDANEGVVKKIEKI